MSFVGKAKPAFTIHDIIRVTILSLISKEDVLCPQRQVNAERLLLIVLVLVSYRMQWHLVNAHSSLLVVVLANHGHSYDVIHGEGKTCFRHPWHQNSDHALIKREDVSKLKKNGK